MHVFAIKKHNCTALQQTHSQKQQQIQQKQQQEEQSTCERTEALNVLHNVLRTATTITAAAAAAAATAAAEHAARAGQQSFSNYYRQCTKYNNNNSNKSLMSGIEKPLAMPLTTTAAIRATTTTSTATTKNSSNSSWRRGWRGCCRHRTDAVQCAKTITSKATTIGKTKAIKDNCNLSFNFYKINKLLLITCMFLITMTMTTTLICQIEATPITTTTTTPTAVRITTLRNNNAAASPLSALLKSGGASFIRTAASNTAMQQQRQLQQQQLFAMLTKNSLGAATANVGAASVSASVPKAAAAAAAAAATSGRHFLLLNADEDDTDAGSNDDGDDNVADDNDEVGDVDDAVDNVLLGVGYNDIKNWHKRVPSELLRSHLIADEDDVTAAAAAPAATTSLETTGFVADDGQQYEKAEQILTTADAVNGGIRANLNNCPKECKCLNTYFDCGKMHLDRMPILPNYVQNLDLAGNKLNDTAVLEIRNQAELHKLSLKRNQLDVFPKFVGLTALKQLLLTNNRIQLISSEAIAALPKLKTLDLSKNFLHAIEANSFPKPNRLAHLILNANQISNVDEHAFETLTDLVDLELNDNRLMSLPGGVFKNLSKLKKLSLNNNHLEINWSTFRGLLSLQKLYLKMNNIRALQDGLFHVMRNIEHIELDHNGITSLSRQGLFNLTKLNHLSLSNNTISRIELDTWEFTQSLETLDLSHNNISDFKPQHLDCLQHLRQLNLGHNKIQYFMENTFDCVKNLEELYLRRNRLAWVIEDPNSAPPFKALRKLKKLDLYGNNLKQINSKSLNGLNNLELLNLGGNALATVQTGAFEHMLRLQKLIFKSLNFICDCELFWFKRFLQTKFAPYMSNAICGYPDNLLDRELQTLNMVDFVCVDSPKPVLTQEPDNLLAVKGDNITMECIATSPAAASLAAADELKIKWRHDNQNVRERSSSQAVYGAYNVAETQIHHDQNTNQTTIIGYLRLYNVSYESAGRYQCVVSNAFGTTYSQRFKISIGIHPTFSQIPSNLTIDAGETARLVCSATGDPIPEIALQKFGASDFPAATERRLQVIREENAFLITNAKPSDTGIYTCTAESAAGDIKINASLIVNDKPLPKIPQILKEVVLGANTVLECLNEDILFDLMQPHREWFKENKPFHISPTSHSERYYFTADKELLVIVNTQSNDAGHYRCEITDNTKTLTLQSELVVVKEGFSKDFIILGVITVTIACIFVGSCIVFSIMCYQKRKRNIDQRRQRSMTSLGRIGNSQYMLSGSRGSALDQTQLTTLNRTYLKPAQQQQNQQQQLQQQQQTLQQQQQLQNKDERSRSLAELDLQQEQRSRLIVTTPNYQTRLHDDGSGHVTLTYLQNADLEQQQDHLSSKDSGTGSDAAVKRSLEDFSITMLAAASTPNMNVTSTAAGSTAGTVAQRMQDIDASRHDNDDDDDDNGEDDDGDDNDLKFAPTRALGVSEYDMELCEFSRSSEHERFLQNNHNYDGGGNGGDVSIGVGLTASGAGVGGIVGVPRKCSLSTQISTNYNKINTTTVDI